MTPHEAQIGIITGGITASSSTTTRSWGMNRKRKGKKIGVGFGFEKNKKSFSYLPAFPLPVLSPHPVRMRA
jgi:hypothetical protein